MEKLDTLITMLKPAERSAFLHLLKSKNGSGESKMAQLFRLLDKGKKSAEVKERLYGPDNSSSAYYQLRKSLLDELEAFVVRFGCRHNPHVDAYVKLFLARRFVNVGEVQMAEIYLQDARHVAENHDIRELLSALDVLESDVCEALTNNQTDSN